MAADAHPEPQVNWSFDDVEPSAHMYRRLFHAFESAATSSEQLVPLHIITTYCVTAAPLSTGEVH